MQKFKILFSLVTFYCLLSTGAICQSLNTDPEEKAFPYLQKRSSEIQTCEELSTELTKGLVSEKDKLRAIYSWITHHIAYDYDQLKPGQRKRFENEEASISYTLASRKAICSGYALLLNKMATAAGIEIYTISGYTRIYKGEVAKDSHAWNGVHLKSGEWLLLDATWDAGVVKIDSKGDEVFVFKPGDDFFLNTPELFIRDHVPFDPIWQFLMTPVSHASWEQNDFTALNFEPSYHFQDSISDWKAMTDIQKTHSEYRRISTFRGNNEMITDHMQHLSYSESANYYNIALDHINYYEICKNKNFKRPKIESGRIRDLLRNARINLDSAMEITSLIRGTDEELNLRKSSLDRQIKKLSNKISDEADYVAKKFKLKISGDSLLAGT